MADQCSVFELAPSHIVWILHPDEETDWSDFDGLDGMPLRATWTPLGVQFVSDQLNPSGPHPDVNAIRHVPIISPAAMNHLSGLLADRVEALPMRCAEAELFALNVPIVDGAIDVDASDVARFPDGRIMRIKEFAFHAAVVATQPIFRIPELSGRVFVNHEFVDRATDSDLTGFRADLVWSSQPGERSSVPAVPDPAQPLAAGDAGLLDDRVLDEHLWNRTSALAGRGAGADLASMPMGPRAFYATRLFEWDVGNGGLHQFFFNHPEPEVIEAVAEGYEVFGVPESASVIRELVAPFAARESEWRESLRDGRIETFFDSYPQSQLDQFGDRVGHHDIERLAYVRVDPESFTI